MTTPDLPLLGMGPSGPDRPLVALYGKVIYYWRYASPHLPFDEILDFRRLLEPATYDEHGDSFWLEQDLGGGDCIHRYLTEWLVGGIYSWRCEVCGRVVCERREYAWIGDPRGAEETLPVHRPDMRRASC